MSDMPLLCGSHLIRFARICSLLVGVPLGSSAVLFHSAALAQTATSETPHFQGALRWYIADLKTSFPEHQTYTSRSALTEGNYVAVLDGLTADAHVNGVRLPIFPGEPRAAEYSALYKKIIAKARKLNLAIYASPLSVGMSDYAGWSDDQYAAWLADYANYFHPDFLSPFNEPGISSLREARIVKALRPRLSDKTPLVGPGRQHLDSTLRDLAHDASIWEIFDIIDSHNANRDESATRANWRAMVDMETKPVWASEDPGDWEAQRALGLPGIKEAIEAGVQGLVIWAAKPALIDDEGRLTTKGRELASRLVH